MSVPLCQLVPPSPFPTVSTSPFSTPHLYSCPANRFLDESHSFILLSIASLCPGPGDIRWCPFHQELPALVGENLSLRLSRKHLNINKIGTLIQEMEGDGRAEKPTGQ